MLPLKAVKTLPVFPQCMQAVETCPLLSTGNQTSPTMFSRRTYTDQCRRRSEKYWAASQNFPTDDYKLLTEEITGDHKVRP